MPSPYIYAGKASKVETNTSDSWAGTQTDQGEMKSAKISFVTEKFEGLANTHGVGGYGMLELELAEATSARRTAIEAMKNVDTYFRITGTDGNTYVVHGPVTYNETRDFSDPKNPHIFKITVKRFCDKAGDFCAAPTDS